MPKQIRPSLLRHGFIYALLGLSSGAVAQGTDGIRADQAANAFLTSTSNAEPPTPSKQAQPGGGTPAGITVSQSGGSTAVTEGGAGDSYTVVLDTQPTSAVTVSVAFEAAQLVVGGDTDGSLDLEFTPVNWSVPQTVTVSAVNDTVVEGTHVSTLVHSATSMDPDYAALDPDDVTVAITDNDTAEIIFASAGFAAVEGAVFSPGATLRITANGAPGGSIAAPIVVAMSLIPGTATAADVTVSGNAVFPAGSTHDTVVSTMSVTVVDDLLVEPVETFSLALSIVSGAATTTAMNSYSIMCNDSAALSFASPTSSAPEAVTPHLVPVVLSIAGVGTGTPGLAGDIIVGVSQAPGSATTPADYQLISNSLTFEAGATHGAVRNIQIAVVNDALIEPNETFQLGFGALTTDLTTVSATGLHTVTVFDNDFAGVEITESGGSTVVTEGGATDEFSLALTAQPTSDVTITFDVGTQVTFAPNPLVITPAQWNVAQTVTVTAVDDSLIEGPHSATVGLTFTGDANFAAITPGSIGITVSIIDNDVPAVVIAESGGTTSVTEGGPGDSYTIQLATAPTQDVSIAIDGGSQVSVSPVLLTFTPANFATAQTVLVSAIDDALIEGPHTGIVTHAATSADPNYNGIVIAPVEVALVDNDFAGVTLLPPDGSTTVTEGGASDSFSLQLTAQPSADVSIAFAVGTQVTFAPNPLVIAPAQWNVPQTITVTAVDDSLAQGMRTVNVGLDFSGDASFAAIPGGSVSVAVTILDNDAAGIELLESGGSTQVTEGGAGDDYSLRLLSQPSADVQVAIDGGTQLVVSPSTLIFTAANWNVPQTVAINAVDDALPEGPHLGSVSHVVSSADAVYEGFAIDDLSVSITDNDIPPAPRSIPVNRESALLLLILLMALTASVALLRRAP